MTNASEVGGFGTPWPTGLRLARAAFLLPVLLTNVVGVVAVFVADADRDTTADWMLLVYSIGLFGAFATAFLPLPSLRDWSMAQRVRSAAFLFMGISYATHLSWELGWLTLHNRINDLYDSWWAYIWWAYIDGGDLRYSTAPVELITIEILSVTNGTIGAIAFWLWFRSKGSDHRAVLLMMATAVVHLYSTSYYYLTEILDGMPNVDTSSFNDSFIKFGLANSPWIIMPTLVLWWGYHFLQHMLDRGVESETQTSDRSG